MGLTRPWASSTWSLVPITLMGQTAGKAHGRIAGTGPVSIEQSTGALESTFPLRVPPAFHYARRAGQVLSHDLA
jgi:hypothetical protein